MAVPCKAALWAGAELPHEAACGVEFPSVMDSELPRERDGECKLPSVMGLIDTCGLERLRFLPVIENGSGTVSNSDQKESKVYGLSSNLSL
jgi:hypothetical protein